MINLTNKQTAILFVMLFIVIAGITLTLFFNTFLFIGTSLIIAFIIAYNSDKKHNK
jgi:hypothetical protein